MSAVTLEEVENQIGRGFGFLRFSPRIEALFRTDYGADRLRLVPVWGVVGLIIYNLIYFCDRAMLPDLLGELLIIRLMVFTPIVLFSIMLLQRWPSSGLYNLLTVIIAILSVTLPMTVAVYSTSPYLFAYQNYNAAAFLFFVISLRPRFPAIVIGLALMCASHFISTHLSGAFDTVSYIGILTFYLTLSVFLVVSAYFLERTDRQNFLNRLRAGLLYRQLEYNAERDELTGLLNRRSLARISGEIWRNASTQPTVSAILLDIDHFKRFNDVHGHLEGDACIRTVSNSIRNAADASSHVFRFGGEEILVLSSGRDPLSLLAMAERIRTGIEALGIRHRGLEDGCVTASLGVAFGLPAEISLEKLLQTADEALYEAKRRGRNIVVIAGAEETGPCLAAS
ncbi:GGDEF domain-containing protein [Neorhizobium alkalisoli]|uniref:diguanylate cyclase n=1 Tax=Neorhizobium alkalisoli TaxID=528178 RepID=A0A561QRT2_9HYPH|nr:GGDEF domain-containing protein [Neorhizobium alkalisoli]TWF53093.1 diguanylate cyclase (GGDEF)-like protein [Neorhizobium alkalisoli]